MALSRGDLTGYYPGASHHLLLIPRSTSALLLLLKLHDWI